MRVGKTQVEGGLEMRMKVEVGKAALAVAVTMWWGTDHRLLGNWSYSSTKI